MGRKSSITHFKNIKMCVGFVRMRSSQQDVNMFGKLPMDINFTGRGCIINSSRAIRKLQGWTWKVSVLVYDLLCDRV